MHLFGSGASGLGIGNGIRQLTRLRQLVDPATRPLTRDQAKTVLQVAGDALADRLRLVLEGTGTGVSPPWHGGGPREVSVALFGQQFSFDPQKNMPQDERDGELDRIIRDIERALKDRVRQCRDDLDEALKYVSEMGRRDAYRLALLRFGNVSLESVWIKAYEGVTNQWKGDFANILDDTDRYEIDQVGRFLRKHPSSLLKKDAIEGLFAQIRFVSGQEDANYLKTVFDRNVEEVLLKIEASEVEL